MEGNDSFISQFLISTHSLPLGRERLSSRLRGLGTSIISIHSLWAEGDDLSSVRHAMSVGISIHSLYVEGDLLLDLCAVAKIISIHSLYAEGDEGLRTI